MTKVINVVLWVPLLFAAFFMIYFIRIYQNEIVAFDEFVLEKQINYAADAAVEELLYTSHLDQDYNKGEYITVEPDLAVTEYVSVLCDSWNMIYTDFNDEYVKAHNIKALIVCAYDGVYGYWYQKSETSGYSFMCTPKIPYFYTDDAGRQYCLTLGLEKGYSDNGEFGNDYTLNKYLPIDVPEDEQRTAINNQVGNILNYALYESYSGGKGSGKAFDIPDLASEVKGGQPVDKISIIGVVEGRSESFSTAITAECIGGAQVIESDPIIGYNLSTGEVTDVKVYARSSYWEKYINSVPGTKTNPSYYDNAFEAAKAGYNDLLFGIQNGW